MKDCRRTAEKDLTEGILCNQISLEKMYGYRDAMHYSNRFEQVIGAACMQAYRIMIPDYRERRS